MSEQETTERTEQSQERIRARRSWTFWVWFLVFWTVVYPLSAGPVFKVVEMGVIPEGIAIVYAPLFFVLRMAPDPVNYCFLAYLCNVWNVKVEI